MTPRVSAVIPTRGRPDRVVRAVRSVLGQTVADVEAVVVLDGPDPAAARSLAALSDRRLVVHVLPEHRGQCAATNAGIARARGVWVGLLDDDDVWLPDKLERQLAAAERSRHRHPILGGRVLARSEAGTHVREGGDAESRRPGDEVWPRRAPQPGEAVSEYLLCRASPFWGERLFQSSVILAERELMLRVPFREDLRRHSDLDWLIRAAGEEGVGIEFVPGAAPLAVWSVGRRSDRASSHPEWRSSLAWVRGLGDRVTPRAYASFLLTWLAAHAVTQGERRACAALLREALRDGRPGPVELLVFAAICGLPAGLRERLSRFGRRRDGASPRSLG